MKNEFIKQFNLNEEQIKGLSFHEVEDENGKVIQASEIVSDDGKDRFYLENGTWEYGGFEER